MKQKLTKKFNAEDETPEVLNVEIVNEEGTPVDETALTEEQKMFCAKIAYRKYRAFSASKKGFNAEEDQIQVTLPEDTENYDPTEEIEAELVEKYEEAPVEETEDDVVVELDPKDYPEEDDFKSFSAKRKASRIAKLKKKFNAETEEAMDATEELDDEIIEALKEIEAEEAEKIEGEGVRALEKFNARKSDTASALLDRMIDKQNVTNTKAAFFAAKTKK